MYREERHVQGREAQGGEVQGGEVQGGEVQGGDQVTLANRNTSSSMTPGGPTKKLCH